MKKYLIILGLILYSFFSSFSLSKAVDIIASQDVGNVNVETDITSSAFLQTRITNLSGQLSSVIVKVASSASTQRYIIRIEECLNSSCNISDPPPHIYLPLNQNGILDYQYATSTTDSFEDQFFFTYWYDQQTTEFGNVANNPIILNPNKYYKIYITRNFDISSNNHKVYGSASNNANGECVRYRIGVESTCSGVSDIFFYINGYRYGNNGIISITLPTNNATTTAENFPYWYVQYNYSTSTNTGLSYGIRYGSTSQTYLGNLIADYADVNILTVQGFASTTIRKQGTPSGYYYAQAFIRYSPQCTESSCPEQYTVATSSIIHFTQTTEGDPSHPAWVDDSLTPGACTDYGVASSTWAVLANCMLYIAFQPSPASIANIQLALNTLSDVFPFNVFFKFSDMIEEITASSTDSATLEYQPFVDSISTNKITILSPNLLYDVFGTSTAQTIFTAQRNIMWLGYGIVVITMLL